MPFPEYPGLPSQALFTEFDAAEQLVSVHGDHEYRDPGSHDIRGPCPGLNAAANHGYLPRSGIATLDTIQAGLWEAYGLDYPTTLVLQQTTSFFDGDPLSQKWSIGYASHDVDALGILGETLLGMPSGICAYGHLKSEGDASITRGDFLAPDMNSNCSSYPQFYNELLDLSNKRAGGLITGPVLAEHQHNRKLYSIANNPNYFSPAFAGVVFTPVAHQFVWALMANHSSENPRGFLEQHVLDSFFSYTKNADGTRTYSNGKDRIPENWYRRSHKNPWTIPDTLLVVASQCLAFPSTCKIGGNLGKVNSFAGVDLGDISGGLINAVEDFTDPALLGCFISQNIQAEAPSSLEKLFDGPLLGLVLGLIDSQLVPALQSLGACSGLPKGKAVNQYGTQSPGAMARESGSRGFTVKDTSGYPANAP